MSSALRRTLGAVAAAGAAATVWGTLIERTAFTLRTATVPILPAGAEPITVLHLSDLHMAPWQRRKQKWVSDLVALQPDLIVDTGDNLGHAEGLLGIRAAFAGFEGIPGVYVWGSNDYFGPQAKNPLRYFGDVSQTPANPQLLDLDALEGAFTGLGWQSLNNRATTLQIKGLTLELFGVDDPHRRFDRIDEMDASLDGVRSAGPAADVSIGVAHAPYRRVLDGFAARGADAILAGHTHGGQVCVPGYGALVTNCDIPREQVKGLSIWDDGSSSSWLNVSAGLGTSIYAPIRFACRPEASFLTLIPSS
ncbi:metallophosphoesterase [Naasia lichenicola]|uniref:metallophosphoesterase n=1 Tax=Naasia lichenicola TaxID=2565933 RepID=UPI0018EEB70C|nr:metallophosphoesterase [Naasia lichenicola]